MAEVKVKSEHIILGTILALALMTMFYPQWIDYVREWFVARNVTFEQPSTPQLTPTENKTTIIITPPTETTEVTKEPKYQISTVNLYLRDALNVKSPIASEEVEVLEIGVKADDPNRIMVDEGTSDANGLVSFTAGRIFIGDDYQYVLRGSTVYDVIEAKRVPVPSTQFKIDSYTFPESIYAYLVGSFQTIGTDQTINLTGKSGLQHVEFDITIGEAEAGKVLKGANLEIKSPAGQELPQGAIRSLYIVKKSGSDLGVPAGNLVDYVDFAPISLTGSYAGYLTAGDSAVYTVKIDYDADVSTAGTALGLYLDDLGEHRGRDIATRSLKAATEDLLISFVQ